jgi:hypothetical protein
LTIFIFVLLLTTSYFVEAVAYDIVNDGYAEVYFLFSISLIIFSLIFQFRFIRYFNEINFSSDTVGGTNGVFEIGASGLLLLYNLRFILENLV